jgi:RNA recognition motif-containing protein
LFGLHPLVKEPPLKKMCEKYGHVQQLGVRSAFASRYGHVEFGTVQQAKDAYKALNGAKLLQKPLLVQPVKPVPTPATATATATTTATTTAAN